MNEVKIANIYLTNKEDDSEYISLSDFFDTNQEIPRLYDMFENGLKSEHTLTIEPNNFINDGYEYFMRLDDNKKKKYINNRFGIKYNIKKLKAKRKQQKKARKQNRRK